MTASAQSCPAEALYQSHHGWLHSWLRARLGCTHQAADLAQDTFVRVLARREELWHAPVKQPRAFLRVIAKGLVVDLYRRRDVEQAFLEALAAHPERELPSPEEREVVLETLQQIDAILDELPAPVREAFLRSQLDGWTYQRIADDTGVSVRTIKRYMHQAFRECLLALL